MLVLTRHVEEKIVLRPTEPAVITIQVQSIRGERVVVGIDAPLSVRIDREEVDQAGRVIHAELRLPHAFRESETSRVCFCGLSFSHPIHDPAKRSSVSE